MYARNAGTIAVSVTLRRITPTCGATLTFRKRNFCTIFNNLHAHLFFQAQSGIFISIGFDANMIGGIYEL